MLCVTFLSQPSWQYMQQLLSKRALPSQKSNHMENNAHRAGAMHKAPCAYAALAVPADSPVHSTQPAPSDGEAHAFMSDQETCVTESAETNTLSLSHSRTPSLTLCSHKAQDVQQLGHGGHT
jgi:hypothetical protein